MQLPLIGRGVQGRARRISPSMLVNCFPEIHDGKLSNASIIGAPGLQQFADIGSDPIRFMHEVDGVLYALSGTTLYSIDSNGTATAQTGTVPDGIKPKVDDNGTQIAIPNGALGYIYTISTNTVAQITDVDYNASSSAAFVGQYLSFIEDNTSQFFISALGDGTDFDSLDFATGESDPDINVSNHSFQGNQWLFGTKTTEVWYVSSEAFPMNPYQDGKWNVGCGARLSVASNEDVIVWVTDKRRVYASTGGKPIAISTPELEYQLSLLSTVSDGEAFMYSEEGHTFYQVSFATKTLVYDFTTQYWFEKRSDYGRHFASHHVFVYGKNLVADYRSGKIYHMSLDFGSDAGTAIIREGILPAIFGSISNIEFTAETGITPLNEPEAQFQLRVAPEGADWGNWIDRGLGKEGETRKRLDFSGLADYPTTYFHWRTSVDAPFNLIRCDST